VLPFAVETTLRRALSPVPARTVRWLVETVPGRASRVPTPASGTVATSAVETSDDVRGTPVAGQV
jgi:hypothetical protein